MTIGLLLVVESLTGIKSQIIGQGDNQVCKLLIPIHNPNKLERADYIKSYSKQIMTHVYNFLDTLEKLASNIGLKIKKEETWISDSVLIYGKDIIINGAFSSQILKKLSRTLTDVNEVYPTIQSKVATLQTSGLSAAQKGYFMGICYVICQLETVLTFSRDTANTLGRGTLLDRKRLVSSEDSKRIQEFMNNPVSWKYILMLNSDIFGTPIVNLCDYLYRGHPDSLTSYLTFLDVLKNHGDKFAHKILIWLTEKKYKVGDGRIELLLSNPNTVNINRVDPISKHFKRTVTQYLKTSTKNVDLRELFDKNSDEEDQRLYEYLSAVRPFNPKVLHEVIKATTTGTRLSFISKFNATRT